MVDFLKPIDISMSGMDAQKSRLEIIAGNIANTDTVMTKEGTFFKRQDPVFETVYDEENNVAGVKLKEIQPEASDGVLRYEPGNPYADKTGHVRYPDISIEREMTDMVGAQRAYEANLAVATSAKSMLIKTLDI
jgi:flagellar basal-body rod protein FlgC